MSKEYGIARLYPFRDSAGRLAFRGAVGPNGSTVFYPIRVGEQMLLRGKCSDCVLYGYPYRAGSRLYARTIAYDIITPPSKEWSSVCTNWWNSCSGALPLRYLLSANWAHCGGSGFSAADDFYVTGESAGELWWTGRSSTGMCHIGCNWSVESPFATEGTAWEHDTYPNWVGGKHLAFTGYVIGLGRVSGEYRGHLHSTLRSYPLGRTSGSPICVNFGPPTPNTNCGVISGSWEHPYGPPAAIASEEGCFAWLAARRQAYSNPYFHTGGLLSAEVAPL